MLVCQISMQDRKGSRLLKCIFNILVDVISSGQGNEIVGHLCVTGGDREEHVDILEGCGRASEPSDKGKTLEAIDEQHQGTNGG